MSWLTPAGDEMTRANWYDGNGRCLGVLLDGRAQETGIRRVGTDATLLLILNAHTRSCRSPCPRRWAAADGCG